MPTRMVINTERVAGYKNKIMQPTPDIKLGINNDVNTDKKTVGLRLMDGGPLKINPPNSHSSNPIHKAVIKAQKKEAPLSPSTSSPPDPAPTTTSQDINKTLIAVGAHLFTGLLVWTRLIPKFLNCSSVLT